MSSSEVPGNGMSSYEVPGNGMSSSEVPGNGMSSSLDVSGNGVSSSTVADQGMSSPGKMCDGDVDSDDSLKGRPKNINELLMDPSAELQLSNNPSDSPPLGQGQHEDHDPHTESEPTTSTGVTFDGESVSEEDEGSPERPPLRRSGRIRKGRQILTYGKLGVPKIQRYSILSLEYKPRV